MNYRIFPPDGYLEGCMTVPLSKSMSNRALIISALTRGCDTDGKIAVCDDTSAVLLALKETSPSEINVGDAGTAMRFLTAYYACQPGSRLILTGSERMCQRPIGPLVEALNRLGASVEYVGEKGYPPLRITGCHIAGGEIEIDSTVSSQFISALLMIAPMMKSGLRIRLLGEPMSMPYIMMTLRMMDAAGAETDFYGGDTIEVEPVPYSRKTLDVEGDWSAAAFACEIQALAMGEMQVHGVVEESCQGDAVAAKYFAMLGVDMSWETDDTATLMPSPECSPRLVADLRGTPDLTQPLVVTCVALGIPFKFSGLETLHVKETDRVEALKKEMLKLGAILHSPDNGVLEWNGSRRPVTSLPVFDTYNDHRMAMSLAPVALTLPGIVINEPNVVTKSFPDYWEQLKGLGFLIVDADMPEDEVKKLLGIEELE